MANPGQYPPMGPPMGGGPMQPMGGPPMGPMGGPPPPARQGTSRMVPVVVSAGLAVGVFCGLLFGLGTGQSNAAPSGPVSNGVKRAEDPAVPESVRSTARAPEPPKAGSNAGSAIAAGSAVAANTGSGAGSADAAGSGAAGSAAAGEGSNAASAEPRIAKLIVEIKPDMAGPTAKVTVEDQEIAGLETEIPMDATVDKKKVKVKVRALGFRDVEQTVEVEVAGETTLKLELIKGRSSLPATSVAGKPDATGNTGGATAATPTGKTGSTVAATPTGKTGGTTATPTGKTEGKATGTKSTGTKSTKSKGKGSGGLIDI